MIVIVKGVGGIYKKAVILDRTFFEVNALNQRKNQIEKKNILSVLSFDSESGSFKPSDPDSFISSFQETMGWGTLI